jgi:Holliday junction resolvase RusA-like endonuclease
MTRLAALPPGYRECPKCGEVVRWDLSLGHREGCVATKPAPARPVAVPDVDYSFVVDGPPVGYKRVGGALTDGSGRRAKDPKMRAHQREVRQAARDAIPSMAFGEWPLELWVTAYHEQPKNGRRLPDAARYSDWDNLGKLVSDACQYRESDGWGAYADDGSIVDGHVRKRFAAEPHTLVRIRTVTEELLDMELPAA